MFWYRKVVEQGQSHVIEAQYCLGCFYYDGEGVEKDYQQAIYWYGKAAEKGHVMAQYLLGECYFNGIGIAVDYQQAIYWYKKAASQRYMPAINRLTQINRKEHPVQERNKNNSSKRGRVLIKW